jgi:hypothetical protein
MNPMRKVYLKNMSENENKKPSRWLFAASDMIALPISLTPVCCAWGVPLWLLRSTWDSCWFYLVLALLPLIAMCSLIVSVRVVRLFLPRMKKGLYTLGLNRGFVSWYMHLALSRAGDLSGLKPLMQSFYLFKFLYWRAQGARIAFGVNSAMGVSIVDYPMIEVGPGGTLSDGVALSAHTFVGDRILIAPTVLGRNVFVGLKSLIGARTRIGDDVWIGLHNIIAGDKILSGTKIENFAWERGNPKRKFASNPED